MQQSQSQNIWRLCYASRKLYLLVSCISIVLGLLLFFSLPRLYSAQVRIADENQTTEMTFHIPDWNWSKLSKLNANNAQEDMEVFPEIINSQDFLVRMSEVQIPNYGKTYGEHIQENFHLPWYEYLFNGLQRMFGDYTDEEYVIDVLDDVISYSSAPRFSLVTFQVLDPDPYVAATMVDSVRVVMEKRLVDYRSSKSVEDVRVAQDVLSNAKSDYLNAVEAMANYSETHKNNNTVEVQSTLLTLQGEAENLKNVYSIAAMELSRAEAAVQQKAAPFVVLKSATVPQSPSTPMVLSYILSFFTLGIVFTTWYVLYKRKGKKTTQAGVFNYFAPWTITIGIWTAIIIMTLMQRQSNVLYPVTEQFVISLSLWLPIFVASSLITYVLLPSKSDSDDTCIQPVPFNRFVFKTIWIISLIITPLYLYNIMKIVSQFDMADLFYNLRLLAVHGDESYGFLNYSLVFNQALFLVAVWRYPHMPLWQLLSIYAVNMMSCFAIMEKGGFFLLVVTTMFVLFQRGIIKVRSIFITIAVLVVVFFFINFMRSEQTTENATKEMTFIDFFAIYVLSPPVAFCRLHPDISGQFGSHTFEVIYLFLNRFGGNYEVNSKLQEFVWVPLPTNVYTIFQPFYQDFGYAGVCFFAMIYGIASGWIYRMFRNGSGFGRCIYSYFVYVLILQFYQENIFLSLVFFVQLLFFVWLMHQKTIRFNLFNSK